MFDQLQSLLPKESPRLVVENSSDVVGTALCSRLGSHHNIMIHVAMDVLCFMLGLQQCSVQWLVNIINSSNSAI